MDRTPKRTLSQNAIRHGLHVHKRFRPELDPADYTVAWIAPLEIEARAALHMLDGKHEGRFPLSRGDDYIFEAGNICGHNVVVATLPAGQEYGTGSAAALAGQIKKFFPNLWFGLLVGVAAGLPNFSTRPPKDIRLGDVLVGLPEGESAGLVAYDLGKETGKYGFLPLRSGHVLANTEPVVRSAIGSIKLRAPDDVETFLPYYNDIKDKEHASGTFADPGQEEDRLYELDEGRTWRLVPRNRRPASKRTRVWYGTIGSGEKLMKNVQKRNELRDRYNLIGLEMEAAGTMNRIPVGVVRGVCDYGDEHKAKAWQPYAAAMAAAYAKAILWRIGSRSSQSHGAVRSPLETVSHVVSADSAEVDQSVGHVLAAGDLADDANRDSCCEPALIKSGVKSGQSSHSSVAPTSLEISEPEGYSLLDSKVKENLTRSLRFEQVDSRQMDIKNAHAKTCQWLLQHPKYIDWMNAFKTNDHHGFLWIKGKAGVGKSTIMKFLLTDTRKRFEERVFLSFFFSARGNELEKSTLGMYRSLLLQLLQQIPRLQSVFDLLSPEIANSRIQWSVALVKTLLGKAMIESVKANARPICFIDAIDECEESQICEMITFFSDICEEAGPGKLPLQFCFSSRHYPNIAIPMGITLVLEGQKGHEEDIAKYLNTVLRIGDSAIAKAIQEELQTKASGVFMWVVLVVSMLNKEYRRGRIYMLRQRVKDIPGDLYQLFHGILTRDSEDRDRLLLCIQWVLFARRPLRSQQLYYAVLSGINSEVEWFQPGDVTEEDTERFVLDSSKGLVEVIESKDKVRTVQFIHESVKDFLLKENGIGQVWPELSGSLEGRSHETLKECCIKYTNSYKDRESAHLSPNNLPRDQWILILKEYVFLRYAVDDILFHANMAQGCGVSQRDFLVQFQLSE